DDEGLHVDGPVALGHRRLQIIDLATGHQPMTNETGTIHAMLNGEIYNFRGLTETLRARGHCFTTRSDTEVIVHAYEEYGEECLAHFNGMFAFVLWDAEHQTLFIARDRMGEKPLYYAERNGWFVFGSELRALLAHPEIGRELDLRGFSRYLTSGYLPDPHTILEGVFKLPPGHFLTVTSGKTRVSCYWDIPFEPFRPAGRRPPSPEAWADALWNSLCASVRHRLVSDVPVGIFLSGGLDSSAVTAAAVAVAPGQRFKSFSIGFEEPSYNEERFACAVADRLGTEHHQFMFTAAEAATLLPRLGTLLDEPLADPAFLPTIHLARHTREAVTVALSGDGGDELLCGYPTFLAVQPLRWMSHLPSGALRTAARVVDGLPTSSRYGSPSFLLKQFFRGALHSPDIAIQVMMGGLTPGEQQRLLSRAVRDACASFNPYEDVAGIMAGAPSADPISRLIYHHCKLYLAGQTLVKMDRGTMACGVEVRAPFLDPALVELACAMPPALKVRGWTTKYVLKRALAGRLPEVILARRKQGFGVPIAQWLRGPLRPMLEATLGAERLRRGGLLDPEVVARLVSEHVSHQRDHRKVLWSLLTFELWREAYLPGASWR
ncbi:MAG: asparagine synthase (glutamine-hydrolyzing), partial [Candidatus Rokuibacteriota bacterium]